MRKRPVRTGLSFRATVHDDEGLNVQVYNRCIGTRYCSNNCPYKSETVQLPGIQRGHDSVQKNGEEPRRHRRSRGVMEKCTNCTQRIKLARITAGIDSRKIRDGEVMTACQAAAPRMRIVFGNLNDPKARVETQAQRSITRCWGIDHPPRALLSRKTPQS